MSQFHFSKINLAAIVVIASLFAGCVVVPAHRHYIGAVVIAAPPPIRVEVYGAPPAPGHIWIGGYWNWVEGRHVWVGGHWDAPHPGYRYVPHHWVQERDGWHLSEGHWERR